jgi:hypothetical protein
VRIIFTLLFVTAFSYDCIGQNDEKLSNNSPFYRHQIELRHDNDFWVSTDHYYTTGTYIEYRNLITDKPSKDSKKQITIGLQHFFYTPTNLLSENVKDFDRPYAGYLGLTAGNLYTNKSQVIDFKFAIGVTGPISMAEDFQNLFHSGGGFGRPTSWTSQIENSVHFNLYFNYVKEWMLVPKPFAVYVALSPKVALGTTNIYVDQGFKFFFGRRNPLTQSMAYHQLGEVEKEFFFSVNFAYRFVEHNALLEGNLVSDDSDFLVKANKELYLFGIEGYYRSKRNDFKIGYQYLTRETPNTDLHIYFTVSLARRF